MFRRHRGLQLLALLEEVLPRHRSGHRGDWHISLSKPSEKEQHLLMTLVGEQGEQEMERCPTTGSDCGLRKERTLGGAVLGSGDEETGIDITHYEGRTPELQTLLASPVT